MSKPKRAKKPKAPPKTRWEKSADRENARRLTKAPLLVAMGVTPLVTAEERQAKHEASMAAAEAQREQHRAKGEAEAAAVRVELEATLTPDELAHVDATRSALPTGHGWDVSHWRKAIHAKREASSPTTMPAEPEELASDPRRQVRVAPTPQLSLFESNDDPGEAPVSLEHVVPPCDDCGWKPAKSPFAYNLHRFDCPGLMGFLVGLWERCGECKEAREKGGRACEAHLARTRACAKEGHIPGPSKRPDECEIACQRCTVGMPSPKAA